eukprot:760467-Hanusia_phi.AAC.2
MSRIIIKDGRDSIVNVNEKRSNFTPKTHTFNFGVDSDNSIEHASQCTRQSSLPSDHSKSLEATNLAGFKLCHPTADHMVASSPSAHSVDPPEPSSLRAASLLLRPLVKSPSRPQICPTPFPSHLIPSLLRHTSLRQHASTPAISHSRPAFHTQLFEDHLRPPPSSLPRSSPHPFSLLLQLRRHPMSGPCRAAALAGRRMQAAQDREMDGAKHWSDRRLLMCELHGGLGNRFLYRVTVPEVDGCVQDSGNHFLYCMSEPWRLMESSDPLDSDFCNLDESSFGDKMVSGLMFAMTVIVTLQGSRLDH